MFNFDALLPAGSSLLPHQASGVATSLLERRLIIGDEPGLGKSLEALVTVEAANAYPAVIVCPATLKDNWAAEIAKYLPHRGVRMATGHPSGWGKDFTIISYAVLHTWVPTFRQFWAVVLDESHNCNNLMRRRSRAALALTGLVDSSGFALCLTGTPFVNKPAELATQLQLIGRLHNFVEPPEAANDERAWRSEFRNVWCKDVPTLHQLNRALLQTCYLRRDRSVIGLKDPLRRTVRLTLNLAEYHEAENDLVSYLAERNGTEAAAKAINATSLSKINHLRRLAGEAKAWAAKEWIDNFFYCNPGRSLVVFAYHKSVQQTLVDHYNCAHILGGERDVEEQKRKFQQGETPLIVVSLTAGKEGHTLTKASDVLFVELGWTPAMHDQAESRVNRLGQEADVCFAWYLLGAHTIDERAWEIVERKRVLFNAVADGKDTEASTAQELLEDYFRPLTRGETQTPIAKIIPIR